MNRRTSGGGDRRSKRMDSSSSNAIVPDSPTTSSNAHRSFWNVYLYQLQLQAPKPHAVLAKYPANPCPVFFGLEYHGKLLRDEAEKMLDREGAYLVRDSQSIKGEYALSIKCENKVHWYRLFFDGRYYVGDNTKRHFKKFASIDELVADGLITLYLDAKAGDYINAMYTKANYDNCPYVTLHRKKKERLKQERNRTSGSSSSGHRVSFSSSNKKTSSLTSSSSSVTDSPAHSSHSRQSNSLPGSNSTSFDVRSMEKEHAFKTQTFIGFQWCDLCSNFMWGVIGQGVRCSDCGFSCHHKCSEMVRAECCPELKNLRGVFGIDLTAVVKAYNSPRPFVVNMCVAEIECRGLHVEGIYRVSPSSDDLEALRIQVDQHGEATSLSSCSDIHVVAGLLKLFLRLLPIPLIPFDQYDRLIAAMKCTSPLQRIGEVRTILARFPPAHFQTTKFLMAHLYRVSCESARNKMTPKALATVFAPTTMRRATLNVPPPSPSPSSSAPPSPAVPHNLADPLSLLTLMDAEKEVIEFLIEREPEVFS